MDKMGSDRYKRIHLFAGQKINVRKLRFDPRVNPTYGLYSKWTMPISTGACTGHK